MNLDMRLGFVQALVAGAEECPKFCERHYTKTIDSARLFHSVSVRFLHPKGHRQLQPHLLGKTRTAQSSKQHLYVYMYVCLCVCVYVCMYSMYICMYMVYVYIVYMYVCMVYVCRCVQCTLCTVCVRGVCVYGVYVNV